jgi:hypothetical protein
MHCRFTHEGTHYAPEFFVVSLPLLRPRQTAEARDILMPFAVQAVEIVDNHRRIRAGIKVPVQPDVNLVTAR